MADHQRPDDSEQSSGDPPRITMDHYHSTRRQRRRPSWPHLVSALVMLATLIMIVIFQDRCGAVLSGTVFQLDPKTEAPQPATPTPAR